VPAADAPMDNVIKPECAGQFQKMNASLTPPVFLLAKEYLRLHREDFYARGLTLIFLETLFIQQSSTVPPQENAK
jgi:hypothetical protein